MRRTNSLLKRGHQPRVVVVGAGVVGCATAYRLARAGFKVTLIERDAIAAHASRHNAGNLNPLHGTPAALIPDALAAFRMHAEMRAELAQLGCAEFVASPVKRVHLGSGDTDRRHLEATAALANATEGFSASWLDGYDLRRMEPRLAPEIGFGVVTEGGLSIDSHAFTRSLAAAAKQLGAVIISATATGIEAIGGRLSAVVTSAGAVACDEVVFATGPWVAGMNGWLGLDTAIEPVTPIVPIVPIKGELLVAQLPGGAPRYDFTWGPACLYRRRGDEVWIGGTMSSCGFDASPTSKAREFLLDGAARIMPGIRTATILDHVAALRPMPATQTPIACRAEGWQNVYIANGGGAKGVLLCVGIAASIRDLVLGDLAFGDESDTAARPTGK